MFFIGSSSFRGNRSAIPSPLQNYSITEIKLQNAIYNDLYFSLNPDRNVNDIEWNFDTILHAAFDGTLLAGNVDYKASEITSFSLKRRLKGENNWITLDEIPISTAEDFKFSRKDFLVSAKEYEWALVPCNGVAEGDYSLNSLLVKFDGLFIVDRDRIFKTILDISVKSTMKNTATTINTLGSKYPYKIKNSISQYRSGTVSGTFIENDTFENKWKIKEAFQYREDLMSFLCDGSAKILKLEDGRAWIVAVTGDIAETQTGSTDHFITSFEWDEIGSLDNMHDLYDNGFVDIEVLTR